MRQQQRVQSIEINHIGTSIVSLLNLCRVWNITALLCALHKYMETSCEEEEELICFRNHIKIFIAFFILFIILFFVQVYYQIITV